LNLALNHLTLQKNPPVMIATCIYIHVKPDKIEKFIGVTTANHTESVKESGNLRFDLIQKVDDPGWFMLYEAYETEEAAANHKTTSHYLQWRDLVSDCFVEPRQGVKYNMIAPKERPKW
jgi:autoinducer 2-degrading protein